MERVPGIEPALLAWEVSATIRGLKYKPGALPGATALAQARAAGTFTPSRQRYWDAARRGRGDAAGTRALIEVLLGHRTLPAPALASAMDKAVASGVLDPQAVLIDARRLAGGHVAPVIPIGALARYDRPAPNLASYPRLAAAIVDRVTFNAHILETGTQTYRLAVSKTAARAQRPAPSHGTGA